MLFVLPQNMDMSMEMRRASDSGSEEDMEFDDPTYAKVDHSRGNLHKQPNVSSNIHKQANYCRSKIIVYD